MHLFRYDTLESYIEYRFGLKKKLDPRDRSLFKPRQVETNWRAEQDADHREKYPSLMEQQMKDGTFNTKGEGMRKKEPMKYTGDLIQGIATMHKSNAVPVMKGTDHAKDIACLVYTPDAAGNTTVGERGQCASRTRDNKR